MTNRKRVFWATTALFTGFLAAGAASAQSSGTVATEATEVETVVVTGARGPFTIEGAIAAETVAKTRSTITQEFIATQTPGQTILQTLNLVPGLNFVNGDPYGNSGGNIRMRGFDGNRVSLTFDGVPLNDSGNYAAYTNQQLDPELISRASVNQGTTDVDSPTASATGGTVNYTTARPLEEAGFQFNVSAGEFDYRRVFARADFGSFGPWGTTGYLTISDTHYDKFKGPGELEKAQYNGKLYQDLGNGNFASLAAHWNVNRNAFYNNFINKAQFESGNYLENDIACFAPVGVNGTVQNDNTQSTRILSDGTVATGSCTNYYGIRINPSNTGNLRGQFSYGLTDNIRFTFDPSFQYTIANGGGYATLRETDNTLDHAGTNATGPGVDLNGDGDVLDTVGIYNPSNTNTHRYGIISSLIWDLNEDHRIRAAYTFDYARHRQTGEALVLPRDSQPANVFSGQARWGEPDLAIRAIDGSILQKRDRFSIAQLNQIALEYRGDFFNDTVTLNIGARAPFFERDLNQYCFSQDASSNVRCTNETPSTVLPNGNVLFPTTGATEYIPPFSQTVKYEDILPNVGVVFRFAEGHSAYASYAEGISVPRTDNLYQPARAADGSLNFSTVQPETTQSYDLGYRFRNDRTVASIALWYTDYQNRIVSSRDNDPLSPFFGEFTERNLGVVEQSGIDAQLGYEVSEQLTVYASASYNTSEVQDDLEINPGVFLPTSGKKLVETPMWTYAGRIDWQPTPNLNIGFQGKFVDDRFTNDVNSESFDSYTVFDLDARYDLTDTFGIRDAYVQLNVTNIFEEEYLGNISTSTTGNRTASLGSPRTAVISIGTSF